MLEINLIHLIDDAKCYETYKERQRYQCKGCGVNFDDLTDTIFAGHHQPLRVWIVSLYFMGLNLSNCQITKELELE